MELLRKIDDFAVRNGMFPQEGLILGAVSGGADSMCLLAALCELSVVKGFNVAAAHFNHMLRGEESDRDEAFVRQFCKARGILFHSGSGNVLSSAGERRIGIEEAARDMRYDFLRRTAVQLSAARIATAHTADDNAETVLLNFTRGAGLKGLGGIPPVRGNIIRPMLTVTRRDVLEYLSQRSIEFVEDSSNSLDIYHRNIIRHRVVPVLIELNPRFAQTAAASAQSLREDEDYLSALAALYIAEHGQNAGPNAQSFDANNFKTLPRPVSGRVIRQLNRFITGESLSAGNVEDVLRLCASDSPSGQLSLPGCIAYREYDRIVFSGCSSENGFEPVLLQPGEKIAIPELGLNVQSRFLSYGKPAGEKSACFEKINKSFTTFLFKYDNVYDKIVIRPRKTGDKIRLFGGNGTKTLKKLFIEKQIPARKRAMIPVIADGAGILAVYGIGRDLRAAYTASLDCAAGDTILEISFEETGHEK